jgi:hypothetical protein
MIIRAKRVKSTTAPNSGVRCLREAGVKWNAAYNDVEAQERAAQVTPDQTFEPVNAINIPQNRKWTRLNTLSETIRLYQQYGH